MRTTSKQRIINRIKETGKVDNFWCIDNRITTRLGAVIFTLKKEGWDFTTEMYNKNCIYTCVNSPEKKVVESVQSFLYKVTEPVTNFRDPNA